MRDHMSDLPANPVLGRVRAMFGIPPAQVMDEPCTMFTSKSVWNP